MKKLGTLFDFRFFLRETRGAIAILFALLLIPLLLSAGVAIDYANYVRIRNQVQSAVDGAALAAAKSDKTTKERIILANQYFNANMGSLMQGGYGVNLVVTDATDKITLTATLNSPNYLMSIVGIASLPMSVTAAVLKNGGMVEVALVFDTTGSMLNGTNGGRLINLQKAALQFVDILFGTQNTSQNVKIGIVPFAAAVNVGPDKGASFGIDVNGKSSVSNYNFIDPVTKGVADDWYNMRAWKTITNQTWNGCVEARALPYAFDDTPPSQSSPETLFAPYFAPDEPGDAGAYKTYYPPNYYTNSWKDDAVSFSTPFDTKQRNIAKYAVSQNAYAPDRGPTFNCQTSPILPLTNDKAILQSTINGLIAAGSTVIPEGVMWGYRLLSPTPPYTEGVAFKTKNYTKIAVILTDGENDIGTGTILQNNHNGSFYSSFGYPSQKRLGVSSLSQMTAILDQKTLDSCALLKSQGVVVYTFSYDVTSQNSLNILKNCASDPSKALSVTPTNVQQEFSTLASQIKNLYLSQ